MVPLADLFVHVYVLVDDAIKEEEVSIPRRPGPKPPCSDAEVLTIALVRHLLGRPSEKAFLEEVRREWRHYFPRLPSQGQLGRRVRWLWGAFEELRVYLADRLPEDPWQQVDTTALPGKHPSRVRGPDGWQGPGDLVASFGWDAAHSGWTCGFRLALRTELGSRLVRGWAVGGRRGRKAGGRCAPGGDRGPGPPAGQGLPGQGLAGGPAEGREEGGAYGGGGGAAPPAQAPAVAHSQAERPNRDDGGAAHGVAGPRSP